MSETIKIVQGGPTPALQSTTERLALRNKNRELIRFGETSEGVILSSLEGTSRELNSLLNSVSISELDEALENKVDDVPPFVEQFATVSTTYWGNRAVVSSQGGIYFGANSNRGVQMINAVDTIVEIIPNTTVKDLVLDGDNLYCATTNGFYKINTVDNTYVLMSSNTTYTSCAIDRNSNLYASTSLGVEKWDGNTFNSFWDYPTSVNNTRMFKTRAGNVYVYGLNIVAYLNYTTDTFVSSGVYSASYLQEGVDGTVFIHTRGTGIRKLSQSTQTISATNITTGYFTSSGTGTNGITYFASDPNSPNGMYYLNSSGNIVPTNITSGSFSAYTQSVDQNTYFGSTQTNGGIWKLDKTTNDIVNIFGEGSWSWAVSRSNGTYFFGLNSYGIIKIDGNDNIYGRKNGSWVAITGNGTSEFSLLEAEVDELLDIVTTPPNDMLYGLFNNSKIAVSVPTRELYVDSNYAGDVSNGSRYFPFKTGQEAIDAASSGESYTIKIASGNSIGNLNFVNKTNISIICNEAFGQWRSEAGSLSISGQSYRIGISGLQFTGTVTNTVDATSTPTTTMTHFTNCAFKGDVSLSSGYYQFDYCQFMKTFTSGTNTTIVTSNCRYETSMTGIAANGTNYMINAVVDIPFTINGGSLVSIASIYTVPSGTTYAINITNGQLVLLLSGGAYAGLSLAAINISGTYSLGTFLFEPTMSSFSGVRTDAGLHSSQVYDHTAKTYYSRTDDSLQAHLTGIDNALGAIIARLP